MTHPTDDTPVAEAREWLREQAKHEKDGGICPVCTQRAKVYERKITSAMARILIAMFHADRAAPGEYVDLPRLRETFSIEAGGGGDATKLRYWDLIEAMPDARREDGSTRVGRWRITEAGRAFVRGGSVPKCAMVYDGRMLGHGDSGETTTIRECLGVKFNYDDLMQPAYDAETLFEATGG